MIGTVHCSECRNTGLVRLEDKPKKIDTIAYCGCMWSKDQPTFWKLPTVDKRIREEFTITPCPMSWFFVKFNEWLDRVKEAEKLWVDLKSNYEIEKWSDR